MLNKTTFSEKQQARIRDARKFFAPKTVVSRTELIEFMHKTYGKNSSPGFITKNTACKAVDKNGEVLRGQYKLPAVNMKPAAKKAAPATKSAAAPKKALSMTKDAIRKRAATAAKSAAPKKAAPAKKAAAKMTTAPKTMPEVMPVVIIPAADPFIESLPL